MENDTNPLDLVEDDLFTVEEVAKKLKTSKSGIYKLLERGELSYLQLGGSKRIPKRFLRDFISRNLKNFK